MKALFVLMLALVGCGGSDVPTTTEVVMTGDPTAAPTVTAVAPDPEKLRSHMGGHVTYPATRAQVLATCADTAEFSEAEKQWVADHLPEGTYNSDADVLKALGV